MSSKVVFTHSRLTLVEDVITLPDGDVGAYLREEGALDAVTVLCRDEWGRLLVEKEYSYVPSVEMCQFPGGGIAAGEAPADAARRELLEETGWLAGKIDLLGSYFTSHRRSAARMFVYTAADLTRGQATTRDEYEGEISLHWMEPDEIEQRIRRGEIVNAPMLAAWALFKTG